jgi:hypothetical protein
VAAIQKGGRCHKGRGLDDISASSRALFLHEVLLDHADAEGVLPFEKCLELMSLSQWLYRTPELDELERSGLLMRVGSSWRVFV